MSTFSRRGFLKTATFLAAAAAIPQGMAARGRNSRETGPNIATPRVKVNNDYDIIVAGGGPAGCAAAIAAASRGCRTLLIEATGNLGGLGTSGMVPAWCPFTDGEKVIYRGLAEKVFAMSKAGVPHEPADKYDWVTINPEYLIRVYDRLVEESGAEVLFFSRVAAVEMSADDTVDALVVANKDGLTAYRPKIIVDATGDGDIAAWAGAPYLKGDADGVLQKSTLCFSVANVDTQAYLTGPELHSGHNPDSASVRAHLSGRFPLLDTHCCHNLIGPGVVQFNANHIEIKDTTDPRQLSDAMRLGRQTADQHLEMLKEYRPDAFKDAFVVKTAIIPGIRDSRRIVGDYLFTGDDWRARRSFDDEIGRNCYFIDIHKTGVPHVHYGRGESHGIPYRCLTPKGLRNVLTAGRCISTDDEAYGSLRVMPPCLVTGEAAGIAAALAAAATSRDIHSVDTGDLRRILRSRGQYFL
ncbi:MAG: FAD-dependent oxidoreductase [Muribaculaceae bacterium]|nr:FAD-dependent oxidoreductase [Muribaculaceae bacterium]